MKVGDLVRMRPEWGDLSVKVGLVIDTEGDDLIVFWNESFHAEIEYRSQLEVVGERDC